MQILNMYIYIYTPVHTKKCHAQLGIQLPILVINGSHVAITNNIPLDTNVLVCTRSLQHLMSNFLMGNVCFVAWANF